MKIISLFSGCGGLDLGLIQAGNEIIWANDFDEYAVSSYKENIGNHIICDDIRNIDIETLPNADVVVGGFPCQGFSMANRKRAIDDERNFLYRFFYNAIKIKQPKFFIAENVKGMMTLHKGQIFKRIVKAFEEAGYTTYAKLFNAADYGVPQKRERVIIVGIRNDLNDIMEYNFPKETNKNNWVPLSVAFPKLAIEQENTIF